MYSHSDPTAARAVGSAEKEWRSKARLAYRYRTDPLMAEKLREPRLVFTGIFSRLLTEPLESLEEMAGIRKKQPE